MTVVFATIVVTLLIAIMVKLSELNGRLTSQGTALDKIQADVQALKDSAGDPAIPADAEASLGANDGKIAAINAILNPAPPTP